ncbi:MAG: hypothetical protein Fur0023_08930 [Bacteroidia bacterium]
MFTGFFHKIIYYLRNKYYTYLKEVNTVSYNHIASTINKDDLDFIKTKYDYYIKNISREDMAISLELSLFLWELLLQKRPKYIMDLGSGFSSYIFSLYKMKYNKESVIVSIDDDKKWIDKTIDFLRNDNLDANNVFILLDDYNFKDDSLFDFILLDLNFVEKRKNYILPCLNKLKKDGLILFDDVHKIEYGINVINRTKGKVTKLYNIENYVRDKYNRYSFLAIR